MNPYVRKVQYYETDQMGITHHANYVRWMEEARIDLMEQMGYPYGDMEKRGVVSPVTNIQCKYLRPTTFGDTVEITVSVKEFNGVVLTLSYAGKKQDAEENAFTAESQHVFLDKSGRFIRMKREQPDFCAALEAQMNAQ